ncbi:MAG: NAD-dependent epimerase/dehydratase family protein [Thermoleophilia bacterium]|nr:NAD-dependent epimerase/dehydratase family protein [Thermoleophilia bacterium]
MATVLVTGASGFVGRHAARALVESGDWVRALVRSPAAERAVEGLDCQPVRGSIAHPRSLAYAVDGCDAVVHSVGLIAGSSATFDRVVAEGTAAVVRAAAKAGVERFVLVSALGVGPGAPDVPYFRSKAVAEQTVRESGMSWAIIRPSVVLGSDGGALPLFVRLARFAPVAPLVAGGRQRIQPVWIGDVARAIELAVSSREDGVIELGGPDVVTWAEFWQQLRQALGVSRPSPALPWPLLRLVAALPSIPLTAGQIRMLRGPDNVVSDGGAAITRLGLEDLVPLDEQLQLGLAR